MSEVNLVTVTLDKERHLRLPLKGMLAFEEKTGISLLKGFDLKESSLEHIAALIWACLLHEDEKLTYDKVILMVDIGNVAEVIDAIKKCILQSQPAAKAGGRPLAKKSRPG